MSLFLKSKHLIDYLLKNPNTIKYKSSYYKFNHKHRSPISLDDFYIFCLNYSIKSNNYIKTHKELINCLSNLEIKPGEKSLLPFSAYFHFYNFENINMLRIESYLKKSKEIRILIENINRAIFTQASLNYQCKHQLTPLENINFFKVINDKRSSPSIELSYNFRFNPFIKKYKLWHKYSFLNGYNFCKNIFILASLRNKSLTHQKVFENIIFNYLSLTSFNFFKTNPSHFINFFLNNNLISEIDFYTKPIFTLKGKDSPLNINKVILNKIIAVNNKNYNLESFYPFSLNLFKIHHELSLCKLTLAHLFSMINLSSNSKNAQVKYSQLIQTIDYSQFKYGFEFLLSMLVEMDEINLLKNKKTIEDNLENLKKIIFNNKHNNPKIKDQNILTLSPLFTFLLEKKYINMDSYTLDKKINLVKNSMNPPILNKKQRIQPNFFKGKKIVLFNEDKIERIENILLHKQLEEDNLKDSISQVKTNLKVHKF